MKIDWEKFNPEQYVSANYSSLHDEDRSIINLLVPHYAALTLVDQAIEIGVGPNVYPLMLMLPRTSHITALDPNPHNLHYLHSQLQSPSPY